MAGNRGAAGSFYEYNTSYTPQAMHDQHVDLPRASRKRPNYRPTSLRWYFVLAQILFIMAAMGVVVWARIAWPDSDNSAVIEHKRSTRGDRSEQELEPRQEDVIQDDTTQDDGSQDQSFLTTVTYVSENTESGSTVTVPGTTGLITTEVVESVETTYWVTVTEDADSPPSETTYVEVITVSGGEDIVTEIVGTSTMYSLIPGTGTEVVSGAYEVEFTSTATVAGSAGTTYTTTIVGEMTHAPAESALRSSLVTATVEQTFQSTFSTTQAASTYIEYGKVTVTAVITDREDLPSNIIQPTAKVVDVVSTRAATTIQIVQTIEPVTIVTTDSQGQWVTITSSGGLVTIQSTIEGATMTFESTGIATATSAPGSKVLQVYEITEAEYFLGKFAPALVAVLISIPLRIIDLNAQLFQPFYALNQPEGASGSSSMILHYSGWTGIFKPFTTLADGYPITFITMLLVLCSSLMTPLATEAIGVKIHGSCKLNSAAGCAAALGVSPLPTHALLGLLAFTIVLLCALFYFLRNFETGLYANPWSIAGIASLSANREIRPSQITENKIFKEMRDNRYRLGFFHTGSSYTEYGILMEHNANQFQHKTHGVGSERQLEAPYKRLPKGNPFIALGIFWRTLFITFMLGLLVLILYHHINVSKQSDFKSFIDGQTFGVRFLFSGLGVILSFGWTALFISVAIITPYQRLSNESQLASDSILLTRPTNGYSGLYSSIKHDQPYLALVAFMTMLSNFMPILLVNIPFTLTQSRQTHVICARLTMGILLLMTLTVFSSFFIRWPDMPVDPRSVAGAMYYTSESSVTDQLIGVARLNHKERRTRIKEMGGRYWYGEVLSRNDQTRMTVEVDHALPTNGR
ncbi:hypothetical protein EDB81DRAFT_756514 [Dactylonectria macrodidyma]|uniref:Uncharacterized protein n=1 Tax=Dactylonectria macrodidyma TaxID=307937 RepID=A0A9P9F886_9HYPO|nr:hypothetical protein EDB81DRAFT_756514 [Dactylonectria macrodidyma]